MVGCDLLRASSHELEGSGVNSSISYELGDIPSPLPSGLLQGLKNPKPLGP
jgi:hypothetical protein